MSLSRREFLTRGATISALAAMPGFLAACVRAGAPVAPVMGEASFGATWFARSFAIDEALLQKVMTRALARGGDFCDIYLEHSLSNAIQLEDGAVNAARTTVDLGAGIRVVQGTRFGYAFTEELTLESLLKAAETASAIARGAPVAAPAAFNVARPPQHYPIEALWEKVGIDQKMPWLQAVNARITGGDPRVIKASAYFSDTSKRVLVATSDGLVVEDSQPMTTLYAGCVAEQNGRRERSGYAMAARDGASYFTAGRLNEIADESVRRTVQLFDAVKPPTGEFPLVLGPGPSGILLHEAIGHGIEADFNRKNVSIFSDRIGKQVAIPQVTVVDSAVHPNQRGSINVDDEGAEGQETVLVENGVLRSYLHDRISARHYQVKSTGSGRRESFRYAPMPRMRNTYMRNGPHDPEEIVRSVKKGIYAESFSNGQVRIGEGSFSFYISSGFLIEDGKRTAPIKDVNIIGNGPEVLSRITMVGNDLKIDVGGWTCGKAGQSVPVSQGLPTTLVSSITIGGTKG
jgi:TldD protein